MPARSISTPATSAAYLHASGKNIADGCRSRRAPRVNQQDFARADAFDQLPLRVRVFLFVFEQVGAHRNVAQRHG
ncbi:MAG: hypothetical protein ACREB3_02980, partial [Burkholderiales bacterium]